MNYNELKKLAESKNFTIKRLAEEIGLSSNGLKRSIEGETMSIKTLRDLCDILQIGISEFFGEVGTDAKLGQSSPEGVEAELRARIAELKQDKAYLQARLTEALAALNDGKKQRIA